MSATCTPSILLSAPDLGAAESRYLQQCVASGWVSTAGPWVPHFEAMLADALGLPQVVATHSGTAALHLMLLAAGVAPGELVMLPDLTFVAPANAIVYCGAEPLLIDVERRHWQLDGDLLAEFLEGECEKRPQGCFHRASGRRIAALLLVHVLGYAGDLPRYQQLAADWGLPLLEDAAEALGSSFEGQQLGNWGQMGSLSFNGNKLLTTGGGGAIICQEAGQAERLRWLARQAKAGPDGYDHSETGFNYAMTSLAAALGLGQLEHWEAMLARRRALHARYRAAFPSLTFPLPYPGNQPNHWLSTALMPEREKVQASLAGRGIETRPLWRPMHQLPMFQQARFVTATHNSDWLYERALSLPSGSGLSEAQQQLVIEAVGRALASPGR